MGKEVKLNIVTKIVYSAISGIGSSVVNLILLLSSSLINLSKYDHIEYFSQQFLGTTEGNPDLVGYFIISSIVGVLGMIVLGIIIHLLITKAGWERDLRRYLLVAIVYTAVQLPLFIFAIPAAVFDLIVDGAIYSIISVSAYVSGTLILYYLEERFQSAS
ncbi:MAG: hypothetical protein ACXACP_04735 [Candidatus Hodarchaeales archaeon]|jgi:hypothetical protein